MRAVTTAEIVAALREQVRQSYDGWHFAPTCLAAADELERLVRELDEARDLLSVAPSIVRMLIDDSDDWRKHDCGDPDCPKAEALRLIEAAAAGLRRKAGP